MTDTPKPDTSDEAVERLASLLTEATGVEAHERGRVVQKDSLGLMSAATLRQLRKELTETDVQLDEQIMKANGLMLTRDHLQAQLTEAQEKLDRANNPNIGCPVKGCPHGTVMGVACNYGGSCRGQAIIDAQEK